MEDSQKLQSVIDALGLTANAFSVKLDYKSHASIYHVLDGKPSATVSPGMRDRIIKAFPNVNYNYLTHGELPILLDEDGVISQANALNIPLQTDIETFKIKKMLSVPEQLDRIEAKLDLILKLKK